MKRRILPARSYLGPERERMGQAGCCRALGAMASPRDIQSPQVLAALALLGIVPPAIRLLLR